MYRKTDRQIHIEIDLSIDRERERHLLLEVLLEECEEEKEAFGALADDEALLERADCGVVRQLLRLYIDGLVLDRKPSQIGHIARLRGGTIDQTWPRASPETLSLRSPGRRPDVYTLGL